MGLEPDDHEPERLSGHRCIFPRSSSCAFLFVLPHLLLAHRDAWRSTHSTTSIFWAWKASRLAASAGRIKTIFAPRRAHYHRDVGRGTVAPRNSGPGSAQAAEGMRGWAVHGTGAAVPRILATRGHGGLPSGREPPLDTHMARAWLRGGRCFHVRRGC